MAHKLTHDTFDLFNPLMDVAFSGTPCDTDLVEVTALRYARAVQEARRAEAAEDLKEADFWYKRARSLLEELRERIVERI